MGGPADDERGAKRSLQSREHRSPPRPGTAAIHHRRGAAEVRVRLRSVVTCEHYDRVLRDPEPIELIQNFTDVMVNLHLDVRIVPPAGFTGKVRIGECRIVRLGDSKINEKWLACLHATLNKVEGPAGQSCVHSPALFEVVLSYSAAFPSLLAFHNIFGLHDRLVIA